MHTRPVLALELKIPPVAVVILAGAMMWVGSAYAPTLDFEVPFKPMFAWGFTLLGLVICMLGVVNFKRADTTVNPTKPHLTSSLVTSGIYRRTRNPMYLGFLLILAGWATVKANLLALLVLPAFVLYMNHFQIKPEERALMSLFGEQFRAYCSSVRRWI